VLYERNEGLKLHVIYMKKDIETCLLFLHSQRWDIVTFISFYLLYIDAQLIAEQVIGSLMTFEDLGDGLNARGFS
jgi:hypothetical protein